MTSSGLGLVTSWVRFDDVTGYRFNDVTGLELLASLVRSDDVIGFGFGGVENWHL